MHPNWKNRTFFTGDNLPIMRGLNSDSVDLIYLDPPFNSNHNYAAPIGSDAAGAEFQDTWTLKDVDLEWHGEIDEREPALYSVIKTAGLTHSKSMQAYLIYMSVRLIEMKRLLKPAGSIYLHCDPNAGHYLKLAMDAVFGTDRHRNEIIWHYGGRGAKAVANQFPRNHDDILFYSNGGGHTYHSVYGERLIPIQEASANGYQRGADGRWFRTAPRGDYTDESIERLSAAGRIHVTRTGNIRIKYFVEERGGYLVEDRLVGSVWNDIPDMMHTPKKERTGYPTQKPLKLLDRIIRASSRPGDMVLDPYAGCATACVAAEGMRRRAGNQEVEEPRQWIGIDIAPRAAQLVQQRMRNELGMFGDIIVRDDVPQRTDFGTLPNYRTHKHTLFGKQEGICAGCNSAFPFRNFTVDHIVPRSRGGSDHLDNLQLLCGACNSTKGNGSQADLKPRLRAQGVIGTLQ